MFRGLAAFAGLVGTVAVRRGPAKMDDTAEAMSSVMSLLEKHEGRSVSQRSLAMARSLEEMALSSAWTGGVKGNLSELVKQMQNDVVKKIEMGHDETQQELDADVSILRTKAGKAENGKSAANLADKALQVCVEQEKKAIQDTVAAENLYNDKTAAAVEPCQREIDTATFSSSSGGPVTVKCDTGTDPKCDAAKADLAKQLETLKSQMFATLDGLAGNHKTAEEDCEKAVKAQTGQLQAVELDQNQWINKHGECAGLEVQRDGKICNFGEKLQEVCAAKVEYDGLVASTQTSGNSNSVADRVSEWKVTQLVVCLLDDFQKGTDVTDQSVETCQKSISTYKFDLDLKAADVQSILDVPMSPTFKIGCVDSEGIKFHGGKWSVPRVANTRTGYDGQVPSDENQTLPSYQFTPMWSLDVSLNADTSPFALAECTAGPGNSPAGGGDDDAGEDAGDGKGPM